MDKVVLGLAAWLLFFAYAEGSNLSLAQNGKSTSVKLKNISRYDKLGPYEVPVGGKNLSAVEAEVCEFIWEHWTQHRLGYVIVTFHSIEGEPSTSQMFVEPDEAGLWHLSTRIERKLIDRRAFSDPKFKGTVEQTDEYKAYEIERIEVPANGLSKRVVIPASVKRRLDSYLLRLKDKDGKEITEW
jgi:hypothetical protein